MSPSGSIHYYFKHPGSSTKIKTDSNIAPGVDVRGDGGMVIGVPSVVPGKGEYRWINDSEIAEAPGWLLDLVTARASSVQWGRVNVTSYFAELGDGPGLKGFNKPLCSGITRYVLTHGKNFDQEELKAVVREAIEEAPRGPERPEAEIQRYLSDKYLDENIAGAIKNFADKNAVSLTDFYAYMPSHSYIYAPTREHWPASSVNARVAPIPFTDADGEEQQLKANVWIDQNQPVEQMTWAPGLPMTIRNRLISNGGWIERQGAAVFNLYRPPTLESGDASKAEPWLGHLRKIYPDEPNHIALWFAWRVQRPDIKINHALVLGSHDHGIGKDTLIEPVKRAVGHWNFAEVSPQMIMGRFNGFLKNVIVRINEARDLGDVNRYQLYDHMKAYTAAPPDTLRVDEKFLREHDILNCVGVVFTSNHKTNGLYLPAEDRRHYVAWSDCTKENFDEGYWNKLWGWYSGGGDRHVAAYLRSLDLTALDPKAPPPKTRAFHDIVDANRAPEDSELADVLEAMGTPKAVTIEMTADKVSANGARGSFYEYLTDRKNRRIISHRFEQCGYVPIRNPDAPTDGLWKIQGKRRVVYAEKRLSVRNQISAAQALTKPQGQ
jgi:hypothetical protein